MTALLKDWRFKGLRCVLWLEGGDKYRACAMDKGVAFACVELPQARGPEAAAATLEAAIPAALRSYGGRFIDDSTEIADIALMSANQRAPANEQIEERIEIAADVFLAPIRRDLVDMISEACLPPGYNRLPAVTDLRVFSYGFLRLSPPKEPRAWDPDLRLQTCIALSRLIHPTSISFQYSGRMIRDPSDPNFEITPGPVTGFGSEAWTAEPERNWLTPEQAKELRDLVAAFDTKPFEGFPRLRGALWYHEYAARTQLIDIRFTLIATALESLISRDSSTSTRAFTHRLPHLGTAVGLGAVQPRDASDMWGRRSSLVHGSKHGGMDEGDFRLYTLMERLLRLTLLKAIRDPIFRAIFATKESLDTAWPLPAPKQRSVDCPSCKTSFAI